MKNLKLAIIFVSTALICLPIGAYIGAKYLGSDTRPLVNMMALDEAAELSRSAIIFESLQKGQSDEAAILLYNHIKTKLEVGDWYEPDDLYEDTKKAVNYHRQKARNILEGYHNQRSNTGD